jgi:hypothetical protein
MEQEKEKAEKEGLTDRAASLGRSIENHRFMSERTEDIINVASKFYNEQLVDLGEEAGREARRKERQSAKNDESRTVELERVRRETRKKEREKMGREEGKEAEREERRVGELEKVEREARKKERRGN